MFIWTFLLRITHTIISQSIADSSWITLYMYVNVCVSVRRGTVWENDKSYHRCRRYGRSPNVNVQRIDPRWYLNTFGQAWCIAGWTSPGRHRDRAICHRFVARPLPAACAPPGRPSTHSKQWHYRHGIECVELYVIHSYNESQRNAQFLKFIW